MWKVNECFLRFTADPDSNIQLLTNCCGELMNAACALYNRIQDGMLCTLAQWNAPPDFNPLDRPDGHICHDVIKKGGREVFLVRDLPRTRYAETDPNVSAYCLKTYVGAPVNCKRQCVGSLCVVYQADYTPDEEEKKVLQILAAAMGVEEERRLEAEALREAKQELESKVEERTAELLKTREVLASEEKLAVFGRLAGCVGHELRNPLSVMNNAVYLLKTVLTDSDETVKEYLEIIKQEIDNSLRIITDLLDFSRSTPPDKISVPVVRLVNDSIGRCSIPENVSVTIDIPGDLPLVSADPRQMDQVFHNLIINALQAMPEGGALRIGAKHVQSSSIGVRGHDEKSDQPQTLNVEPDTDFVEISIEDTGEGISEENMKKLFQPLFTTKSRGIGLGLVVSRNLAEANGGSISVESKLREGTTFTVALPVGDPLSEEP